MELKNDKLFIDGVETTVENLQIGIDPAVPGSDMVIVPLVPINTTIACFGKYCAQLREQIEAFFWSVTENLTIEHGRIVSITGYHGNIAIYMIRCRKRKYGGGWAVVSLDESGCKARWLRSPRRPFRSLKSARMALKRRGVLG